MGLLSNNLAQLLQTTNRLAEAEPLMQRALTISIASLGIDHPTPQAFERNYIGLLKAMGHTDDEIRAVLSALLHRP